MNVKKLILEGENVSLDFKNTISSAEKIAKTLVAFANNRGGKLLIGVADDQTIRGVKSEEEEKYMINKAANIYCKPALEPVFQEIMVDHKLVLVVEIKKSDTKPHYARDEDNKWWVYYRVKDKSLLVSKIIIDVLKDENNDVGQFISYSQYEKELLAYLEKNGRITLKEFSKLTRCSYKKAQKIIVSLILTDVLIPNLSEKEEFFTAAN